MQKYARGHGHEHALPGLRGCWGRAAAASSPRGEPPFGSVSLSRAGVETPRDGEAVGAAWGAGYG